MSEKSCISLNFARQLCLAGGTIHGDVEVDFHRLQEDGVEEVVVKLKGSIFTNIYRNNNLVKDSVPLVRGQMVLWKRGSAYPSPGAHTMVFPFSFQLPQNLPPSFSFKGMNANAVVSYELEAVATRPGALRRNRRIAVPFAVVAAHAEGALLKSALHSGWHGSWRTITREDKVRKAPWGEHAQVQMRLSLPSMAHFPLFTPIPYSITIVTHSKPMRRDEVQDDRPIFPVPPVSPNEVQFELRQNVWLGAGGYELRSSEKVPFSSGLSAEHSVIESSRQQKVWEPLPGHKELGTWRQEVSFSSQFVLRCPPSFQTKRLSAEYRLHVHLNFGKLVHGFTSDTPIHVVSGMLQSAGRTHLASYASSADVGVPSGDLSMVDLPPSYWETIQSQNSNDADMKLDGQD